MALLRAPPLFLYACNMEGNESMEEQSVSLKNINTLGYDVIATVYQTNAFKAGIKFDNNGKLLIIHEGRVICSFHAENQKAMKVKFQQLLARRNTEVIMAQDTGTSCFLSINGLKAYYEGSTAHKTDSRRWMVSRPDARQSSTVQTSNKEGDRDSCRKLRRGCQTRYT